MSKFKKMVIFLIAVLLFESLIIYIGYKRSIHINSTSAKPKPIIVVDTTSNILEVFQEGKVIKKYVVSSGKPSTPSPIGTWKIINKDTWGEGFGGYWMGFNVPWGRYGIHGTNYPELIGSSASHGCIRMLNKDVKELFKMIPYGTPVIIWSGPYGNFGSYLRTIKPGMTGSDVYEVQRILSNKGYYKAPPDGIYGEYLKQVIHKYQKDNKLPISDNINYGFYKALGVYLME